jgi:hypothetical protein
MSILSYIKSKAKVRVSNTYIVNLLISICDSSISLESKLFVKDDTNNKVNLPMKEINNKVTLPLNTSLQVDTNLEKVVLRNAKKVSFLDTL